MSCLVRGICQLKMLPANEITEPLVLTVRKVGLRSKALCYSHVLGAYVLGWWSTIKGETEKNDVQQNKNKLKSNC